jgi:hypothetical protein
VLQLSDMDVALQVPERVGASSASAQRLLRIAVACDPTRTAVDASLEKEFARLLGTSIQHPLA